MSKTDNSTMIRLKPKNHKKVKAYAERLGMSATAYVNMVIALFEPASIKAPLVQPEKENYDSGKTTDT